MSKLKELNSTTKIVKHILTQDIKARNSDVYLYIKVCEHINPESLNLPFMVVLSHLKDLNLPCFETVRRTRQKLQQCYPDLVGNSEVEAHRILHEEEYRNYARQVIV